MTAFLLTALATVALIIVALYLEDIVWLLYHNHHHQHHTSDFEHDYLHHPWY